MADGKALVTNQSILVDSNNYVKEIMGKKVEHTEEAVLWTNLSPTSAFSQQTISMSKKPEEFTYLIIYYTAGIAVVGSQELISEELKVYFDSNYSKLRTSEALLDINGNDNYYRTGIFTKNSSSVLFYDCKRSDGTSTNSCLVPYKIIGIKY